MTASSSYRTAKLSALTVLATVAVLASLAIVIEEYHAAPDFVVSKPHKLLSSRVLEFNTAPPMIADTYIVQESFWTLGPAAEAELGRATMWRRTWLPQGWFLQPRFAPGLHSVDIVPGRALDHFMRISRERTEQEEQAAKGWTTVTLMHKPGFMANLRLRLDGFLERFGLRRKPPMGGQCVNPQDLRPPPGVPDFTKP